VSHAPAKNGTLIAISVGLLGLMGSLFVRRRRVWVRVVPGTGPGSTATAGHATVQVGGLDRTTVAGTSLADEVTEVASAVAGPVTGSAADASPSTGGTDTGPEAGRSSGGS
jgi:cytochrome c biogenesis protein